MGEANGDVDEPAASTQVVSSGEGTGNAAEIGLSVAAPGWSPKNENWPTSVSLRKRHIAQTRRESARGRQRP
jgi:hypothetical protein